MSVSESSTQNPELIRLHRAHAERSNYLIFPDVDSAEGFVFVKRDGTTYHVTETTCDCMDAQKRGGKCKHSLMLELRRRSERLRRDLESDVNLSVKDAREETIREEITGQEWEARRAAIRAQRDRDFPLD